MKLAVIKNDCCSKYIAKDIKLLDRLLQKFREAGFSEIDKQHLCWAWHEFSQEFNSEFLVGVSNKFLQEWFDYFVNEYFMVFDDYEELWRY